MHPKLQEKAINNSQNVCEESYPRNLVAFLKAATNEKDVGKGIRIHADIVKLGLLGRNPFIVSCLINMYTKCGFLARAQEVFNQLPVQNMVPSTWNALITGYCNHGLADEALECFERMLLAGISPDGVTYVCALKACGSISAIDKGENIHREIVKSGLLGHNVLVGNTLVDMYAKCGCLQKAHNVFNNLQVRSVVSWNVLIAGYARHEHGEEALGVYGRMQLEEVPPVAATFISVLKACAHLRDLQKGQEIYAEIVKMGWLEEEFILGNSLVSLYARCDSLSKAQEVFDKLPIQNAATWNALIAVYSQQGNDEEALKIFHQMQVKNIIADANTFVIVLKVCGILGAVGKGQDIHDEANRMGLLKGNIVLGSSLIDMYAKCGSLVKAQEIFNQLSARNVVSWSTLIAGYAQHGHSEEALRCYARMKLEGISPDAATLVSVLKACGGLEKVDTGQVIHAEIYKKGFLEKDIIVGNALVSMYATFGMLETAKDVFDELPPRNTVSWSALIAGYVQHGHAEEALSSFGLMQCEGISPDAITFVSALKACGDTKALDKGRDIHFEVSIKGLIERDIFVANTVIDMYVKCGSLSKAQEVFDKLLFRDAISWNVLIGGYVQHGCGAQALDSFAQMQQTDVSPDAITFICVLQACGCIGAIYDGQEIHSQIMQKGIFERNIVVGNALIDMYVKCGSLVKAQEVFDKHPVPNIVSWNSLISGYAQHGHGEEAFNCFGRMEHGNVTPDAVTFISILKACGSIGAAIKGQDIHAKISRTGLIQSDISIGNAIVDMYAKCGFIDKALKVFDELPVRDTISWSALISASLQHGHGEAAVELYEQMQLEGVFLSAVTFTSTLRACGSLGAIQKGQVVHIEVLRRGLLKEDIVLGNALVDMYLKCGCIVTAQEVFNELPCRDGVSWNGLIAGYAQCGSAEDVFHLFGRMIAEGIEPDMVTFVSVLHACSHRGLLDRSQMCFVSMIKEYGIIPNFEHYTCMVDLLSRAGLLCVVPALIRRMPFSANIVVWHAILGACRGWGNVKLGRVAFDHAVQLDEEDPVAYICMSYIYMDAGMQEDADRIDAMREKMQACREGGHHLWTDPSASVPSFIPGDLNQIL